MSSQGPLFPFRPCFNGPISEIFFSFYVSPCFPARSPRSLNGRRRGRAPILVLSPRFFLGSTALSLSIYGNDLHPGGLKLLLEMILILNFHPPSPFPFLFDPPSFDQADNYRQGTFYLHFPRDSLRHASPCVIHRRSLYTKVYSAHLPLSLPTLLPSETFPQIPTGNPLNDPSVSGLLLGLLSPPLGVFPSLPGFGQTFPFPFYRTTGQDFLPRTLPFSVSRLLSSSSRWNASSSLSCSQPLLCGPSLGFYTR